MGIVSFGGRNIERQKWEWGCAYTTRRSKRGVMARPNQPSGVDQQRGMGGCALQGRDADAMVVNGWMGWALRRPYRRGRNAWRVVWNNGMDSDGREKEVSPCCGD